MQLFQILVSGIGGDEVQGHQVGTAGVAVASCFSLSSM